MNDVPAETAATQGASPDLLVTIVERLLDWPFLGLLVVLVVVLAFRKELSDILRNRKFDVEIAGNKLTIGEAVEEIDRTTEDGIVTVQETVRKLEERLDELLAVVGGRPEKTTGGVKSARTEHDGNSGKAKAEPVAGAAPRATERDEIIWERVRRELLGGKFVWRTLERLALVAGATREEVHDILASHPGEVKIGRGKSGRTIARHLTREPPD